MKQVCLELLLFLLITCLSPAQKQGQARLDSLLNELSSKKQPDTTIVNLLNDIAYDYNVINPDIGIEYAKKGISLAETVGFKKGLAQCFNALGVCYWAKSNYPEALENLLKSLKINEEIGNFKQMTSNWSNIGLVYFNQGDYRKALEFLNKALDYNKENSDRRNMASNLSSIGNIYNKQSSYYTALDYYFQSLKINREINYLPGTAVNLVNIGKTYQSLNDFKKSLEYFFQALELNKQLNRKRGIMLNMAYIGEIYRLIASGENGNGKPKTVLTNDKKNLYLLKSIDFSLRAAETGKSIDAKNELIECYRSLSMAYRELGNWEKAYFYADSSNMMKDSVFSVESQSRIMSLEFQQEKELKDREIKIQKLEIKQGKTIIYFAISSLILIIFLTFFIYTKFVNKKKSNIILEQKNKEISKQKDIAEKAFNSIKMLSNIGREIISSLTAGWIIDRVYDSVSTMMNSTVFGIGIFNPEKNILEFTGAKEQGDTLKDFFFDLNDEHRLACICFKSQQEIIISDYFAEAPNYITSIIEPVAGKNTESLLYLPLNNKEKHIGVITVQSFDKNAYTSHHIDILKNLSLYVAIALDNADAYRKIELQNSSIEAQNQVLEKQSLEISSKNDKLIELNESMNRYLSLLDFELKQAADYVKSLIPQPFENDYIKTNWLYMPSAGIGGDSLGYHWLDDKNFAFYIIDVSGHGVGSALHSVSILNSIRKETIQNVDFSKPESVLKALNSLYKMEDYNDMFFTIWYGVYNTDTGILSYAGAGHPSPILLHSGGCEFINRTPNVLIGCISDFNFQSHSVNINHELTIYVFSDGVYEIQQHDGKYWTIGEMSKWLCNFEDGDRQKIEALYSHVSSIRASGAPDDDFTILEIKIK